MDNEEMTMGLMMVCEALGIDPATIMAAGRMTPDGYELRVMIVPDIPTGEDVVSEAERIINNG